MITPRLSLVPNSATDNSAGGLIPDEIATELYVIAWEDGDDPFVKVGITINQRWQAFLRRGGRPVRILRVHTDEARPFERLCLAVMAFEANPRFPRAVDATPYLGGSGAGFQECFRTSAEHVDKVVAGLAQRYLHGYSQVAV